MRQYNIDFFDFSLNNIHHEVVEDLEIEYDYLSPSENSIEISKTGKVDVHDLLYIRGLNEFLGIITKVSSKEYTTEVSFKPFISLFEHDVPVDIRWQGSGSNSISLEMVIANIINRYWRGSSARVQDISSILNDPTLSVSTSTNWRFGLKADTDRGYRCAIPFYSDLIAKALSKYRIAIVPVVDFTNKKVTLQIGRTSSTETVIETNLNNVEIETFTLKEASTSVNVLEIWHEGLMNARYKDPPSITYYKHKDGSWSTDSKNKADGDEVKKSYTVTPDRDESFEEAALDKMNSIVSEGTTATVLEISLAWGTNGHMWRTFYYLYKNGTHGTETTNRVLPGVIQLTKIDISDDESFDQVAEEEADSFFSGIEYTNLIELNFDSDDALVNPKKLDHGKVFRIYKDNVGYYSILTGFRLSGDVMTLVFGTIRHDLTKKLKR